MRAWEKGLAFGAAGAGLSLAGVYGAYRYIFDSPRGNQNDDHAMLLSNLPEADRARAAALIDDLRARAYETVSITSFDGWKLNGRCYHVRDGAPLAILCHGYRGTPVRDFCGGAKLCLDGGINTLLIEQRAHCSSEGHTISFGINERYDCLAWCRYAAERFGSGVPIVLMGISMGAATVLMASELDLPENVRGIIADCPYTSPGAIIGKVGEDMGLPAAGVTLAAALGARLFGHFSLDSASAVSAVRRAKVPILLIHGEDDGFVPCAMGREIAAANPEKIELATFPGAHHGTSYLADTERYTRIVRAFCERVLGGSAGGPV